MSKTSIDRLISKIHGIVLGKDPSMDLTYHENFNENQTLVVRRREGLNNIDEKWVEDLKKRLNPVSDKSYFDVNLQTDGTIHITLNQVTHAEKLALLCWNDANFPKLLKDTFQQVAKSSKTDFLEDVKDGFGCLVAIVVQCLAFGTVEVDTGLTAKEIELIGNNHRISKDQKDDMVFALPFLNHELKSFFQGIADLTLSIAPSSYYVRMTFVRRNS